MSSHAKHFGFTEDSYVEEELERARVVAVLDKFNPNWHMALAPDGGSYCLPRGDALAFDGPTPDSARAAAVAAIEKGEVP